jgi:hypothetical protein
VRSHTANPVPLVAPDVPPFLDVQRIDHLAPAILQWLCDRKEE